MNWSPQANGLRRATLHLAFFASAALVGCEGEEVGHRDRIVATRQEAVTGLQAQGATVTEKKYPQGDGWAVDFAGNPIDEEAIEHLKALANVTELHLKSSPITDQQLIALGEAGLLNVTLVLDIRDTAISDAGLLGAAPKLAFLMDLKAKGSKVTANGVSEFREKQPKDPLNLKLKTDM